ncbi:hypothetical protein QBC46DRAFT_274893, partial [Diplogelasinospora grovesii]
MLPADGLEASHLPCWTHYSNASYVSFADVARANSNDWQQVQSKSSTKRARQSAKLNPAPSVAQETTSAAAADAKPKQSRRVFVRIPQEDPTCSHLRTSAPATFSAWLETVCKLPRTKFQKTYAVSSGYCVEFKSHKDRKLLVDATAALTPPLVSEMENPNATSYFLSGVPLDVPGAGADTKIVIDVASLAAEIKAVIGLVPSRVLLGKTREDGQSFTIVLPKKVSPFRVFGSDAAKLLRRNPTVRTCARCFGFHDTPKCSFAAVCADCGAAKLNHPTMGCDKRPQCPNCLGPFAPGHAGCPCAPKVVSGRVVSITKDKR